jgi:hypothetical protein
MRRKRQPSTATHWNRWLQWCIDDAVQSGCSRRNRGEVARGRRRCFAVANPDKNAASSSSIVLVYSKSAFSTRCIIPQRLAIPEPNDYEPAQEVARIRLACALSGAEAQVRVLR